MDDNNNNMNHQQIMEPMIPHNNEEEDRVQRSDDKNVGKMDKHPQESQVMECNFFVCVCFHFLYAGIKYRDLSSMSKYSIWEVIFTSFVMIEKLQNLSSKQNIHAFFIFTKAIYNT